MKYILIILELHYKQEAKFWIQSNKIKNDFKIMFKSSKYLQNILKSVLVSYFIVFDTHRKKIKIIVNNRSLQVQWTLVNSHLGFFSVGK